MFIESQSGDWPMLVEEKTGWFKCGVVASEEANHFGR
jgi:hypothetical protein